MSETPAAARRRTSLLPVAALLVVGLVSACTSAPGEAPSTSASSAGVAPTPQSSTPPNLTYGVPIPAGRVDEAVSRLDTIAADVMARSRIPGMAVAVVHDGKVLYAKGFGVRKVGSPETVDADTVFQLASVSKPLGATVVAAAVGKGAAKWTDPVVSLAPTFALSDPWVSRKVTLADLYSHRSGLPDHVLDNLEDLGATQLQVQRALRHIPLAPFRAHYAYTNAGLTVAGEAVARSQGTTWAQLSQDLLYGPLGMTSTSSTLEGFLSRSNRAAGHVLQDGSYVAAYVRDPDAEQPAGGASSSVDDLAKWLMLRLDEGRSAGEEVVDGAALLATTTPSMLMAPPAVPAARASSYALGMISSVDPTGRVSWSHSGAFALGAGTAITLIPSEKLGIVTLTNAAPVGAAEAVNASFVDEVEFGAQTRDWFAAYGKVFSAEEQHDGALVGKTRPESPAPPLPLAAYAGGYVNDAYGPAAITVADGGLRLTVGPKRMTFPLEHWDANTFVWVPPGENGRFPTSIVFRTGGGGAVTGFVSEHMADDGTGLFRRATVVPEAS